MQPDDPRAADEPDAQAAFEAPPPSRWWARSQIRLGALLTLLAGALVALAFAHGGVFDLGGGAASASGAFRAGCPGNGAPEPARVPARDLASLRAALLPLVSARVGRVFSEGTITTSNLWTDNEPLAAPGRGSPARTVHAAYEVRWWVLDRDGREDDVAADVLEFASERQADEVVARAASARCRRHGHTAALQFPAGARGLFWVNPDRAMQWDALLARGRRVYRLGDVPPGYLLLTTGAAQSRLIRARVRATPALLACKLPAAGCPGGSDTHEAGDLAPVAVASAHAPARPPSRAHAAAYARAVNLRSYDVPGMAQLMPEGGVANRDAWAAFAGCVTAPSATPAIATLHSPVFRYSTRLSYGEVYSTVAVLRSEALANRYLAELAGARARACIGHSFRAALMRTGSRRHRLRFGRLTLAALPASAPPSYRAPAPYRAVALRAEVQTQFTTREGRRLALPLYADGFAFAYGPAVVELSAITYARPLPDANERFLTAVLVGRAQVNPVP